jgi:hypothetical protein
MCAQRWFESSWKILEAGVTDRLQSRDVFVCLLSVTTRRIVCRTSWCTGTDVVRALSRQGERLGTKCYTFKKSFPLIINHSANDCEVLMVQPVHLVTEIDTLDLRQRTFRIYVAPLPEHVTVLYRGQSLATCRPKVPESQSLYLNVAGARDGVVPRSKPCDVQTEGTRVPKFVSECCQSTWRCCTAVKALRRADRRYQSP